MAVKCISITEFVSMMEQYPILDVRSPLEYAHAHMKNAYTLPLFSDEERKVVGTAYKQQGKQPAGAAPAQPATPAPANFANPKAHST